MVVAFDGTDYLVVWHEDNYAANFRNFDTLGRRISTDGTFPDEKGIPIGTAHGHQFGPRVAFDNNKFLIVWNESLSYYCYDGCIRGQILQKDAAGQYTSHSTLTTGNPIDFDADYDSVMADPWVSVPSPTSDNITSISGVDAGHIYATGFFDVIRCDGGDWYLWDTLPIGHMYAIRAASPDDIRIVGWCWSEHYYNGSTWESHCYRDGIGMGIWGSSSSNIFAVGAHIQCRHYNGQEWQDHPTGLSLDLWDVWGTASNNIYAVGEFNTIIHYNGDTWSDPLDVPTIQSLNDIWGSGPDDIFVVGDFGTIIHYDGASWSSQSSGTSEHLFGIWGFTSTHVYAVGLNGTILSYNGNTWNAEASGTGLNLLDVWGTGDTVWAVGLNGLILKKTLPCAYPAIPNNLSPADGATLVPVDTALDWTDSTGADSYDIYLGTTYPLIKVETVTDSFYTPSGLMGNKVYYWKITAKNACGEIPGIEWVFTTGPAPPPSLTITSPNGGENLSVGGSYDITWTSEGTIGNVMIEYSFNGGSSWNLITASTENDGNFNWTVPGTPSDNCLVRVSEKDNDNGPRDVSDTVFFIVSPVSGSLTLRSPNGGESWFYGSTQEITWSSTGEIGSVNIKYSTDNGTTWKTIIQSTLNDGSYNWTVPFTASDVCLVLIAGIDESDDSGPSDVSDAVFSIVLPQSPSLRVTAPNGGEQLIVGSRFFITWEATGFRDEVKIEYSTAGGDSWTVITPAAHNNGKYEWLVPDDASDSCLVRVSNTAGEPFDESDRVFSIVLQSQSVLRVLSPNGGESWDAGSVQEITWSCTGDINNVSLEYSTDKGLTWKEIVPSTANDGSFDWTVPETVSDFCLVRVTANDGDPDPLPSDMSDDLFSIVLPGPTIRVITPNGGEQLPIGSRFEITWYGTGSRADVKIEYSTNAGDTWNVVSETTPNDGQYDWNVPETQSEACLVRISEIGGTEVDVSDAVFSIVPPLSDDIVVTSPNGGESWTAGTVKGITWTGNAEINNVRITYSQDNGLTWKTIVQSTPNDGSFDWAIPAIPSDECLVQVSANDGDSDPVPSDISDQVFTIVLPVNGEFKVTSPNGGESWEVGSHQTITWSSSGDINSVMIEYSADKGNSWSTIASPVSNTGSFDWMIPDRVSNECLVRVTANDGGGDPIPSDVSDEVFSIVLPSGPFIRVITPNGGEQLVIGSTYQITWFGSDSRESVKIEYSTNSGDSWTEITASTENDGDYDWLVPNEPSETCLLRVSEVDGQPVDVSDAIFSIVPAQIGDLTVVTPNGGENLEVGTEYNISWTCSGLNNLVIEYSVNSGQTWLYIDKVPADNGSYTWTVPGTPSENCLVRVSGADSDENPVDFSDEVFTIFDPARVSIEVFTPNGGESLTIGDEYYITWASEGVTEVFIEYSPDNGEQWIPIDTVPGKGGRFTWTVPDTPSQYCLIRISSPGSPGEPSDTSDTVFTITPN